MDRPAFESLQAYGSRFTDAGFWRLYVEEVCRRHDLDHRAAIRSGLPGTHPVFMVGDRWVVKFFSDLFGGAESFAIERECYRLLAQIPEFPAARFVAEGSLFPADDGWHWPYLVSTLLPGISLGEVYDTISAPDRERIAQEMGRHLLRLHHIPLEAAATVVLRPDWAPFCNWLRVQRDLCLENHRRWQSLPKRLIEQIDDYLPDIETLVDRSKPPLLLHCDMNADHLLGDPSSGRWISSGIIDFGDARVGDFHYELVALHLGLFRYDARQLRAFLAAYGSEIDRQPGFAMRAMSFALLHEYNVLEAISEFIPDVGQVQTLSELADRIWRP